jgi:hypothetical protein
MTSMEADFLPFAFQESVSTRRAWTALSHGDKDRYVRLRTQFITTFQESKSKGKALSDSTFRREVQAVVDFTGYSETRREERSIVAGLACGGHCLAINNRELKKLLGRCKSSINGSFQRMGYCVVKGCGKARECVLSLLPSLHRDAGALRQWTVRYSDNPLLTTPDRPPDFTVAAASDGCLDSAKSDEGQPTNSGEQTDASPDDGARRTVVREPVRFWDDLFLEDDQFATFLAHENEVRTERGIHGCELNGTDGSGTTL